MKGIIFNLAEEVVRTGHGEDAWDAVLERAGLEGTWTSLGDYPDEHLSRVVSAAAGLLGVDEQAVLRIVGQGSMPVLARRYPHFFEPHADALSFILTLNGLIHPEVKKLYPGATPPDFGVEEAGDGTVVLSYTSARRLCALAEGFIQGAAEHYGQTVTLTQSDCELHGDARCLIHCRFAHAG